MNQIILYITVGFAIIGAVDRVVFNSKFGFGTKFEEGIEVMGLLVLAMVGLMCFAPVLGNVLTPIITPFYKLIGADPAMFAGTILALDMGGYPLAQAMTGNSEIVVLSGLILGSMLGCTIVFSIPVALGIVEKDDQQYLAKGILIGIIAVPVGAFISAMLAGLDIRLVLVNLLSVVIISLLIVVGLLKAPNLLMKIFNVFAKFITALLIITLTAAIIEGLLGITIIPGMEPIGPQLEIVGYIAITLAGAYPMVHFITKVLSKLLAKVGSFMGVNDVSVAGMIAALANSIPTFNMVKDMNPRGKIMAIAFSVPAATAFGDHLGYVAATEPKYIFPVVVGKLAGGLFAIVLALLFTKNLKEKE